VLNGIVYWIALSTNYSVAFAPAIAALVGIAGRELWRGRNQFRARITLAVMVAVNGCWDYVLLSRTPTTAPPLGRCCVEVIGSCALACMASR
jgi:hypothetical protein